MAKQDPEFQRLLSRIVPEAGFDFDPPYLTRYYIDGGFSRVLAHLVGRTSIGSRAIEVTPSGNLKVAIVGSGFESYKTHTGTCSNDYDALRTYENTEGYDRFIVTVETYDAIISLKNQAGTWGDDIILPVGVSDRDISFFGIKIKNRGAGENAVFQIEEYY